MTTPAADSWQLANQRYLTAAVEVVGATLAQALDTAGAPGTAALQTAQAALEAAGAAMPAPPALETLCERFGLSPFEHDLLLLCAGVALSASLQALLLRAESAGGAPTFGLALAALPEAHWSAITPDGPLRYWRLIEIGAGHELTSSPLRIDERILHELAGVAQLDTRLAGMVKPLASQHTLPPSHWALAGRIAATWTEAGGADLPAIQLCGDQPGDKQAIAAAACAALELELCRLPAFALPAHPAERAALVRLWEREAVLGGRSLLLDCDDMEPDDAAREHAVAELVARVRGPLLVTSRERRRALDGRRLLISLDVARPSPAEQRTLWRAGLQAAGAPHDGLLDAVVEQFHFGANQIASACAVYGSETSAAAALWEVCRGHARARLGDLARRIEPAATWDDLVLPHAQVQMLREIAAQVRQRALVYERWGFAAKSRRGLGISALFAGMSGTGKTMAAEVLAGELGLDLYRIDLAGVVSKYIGETEKNLRRIFDAAEASGAILLFDEADALFGKRSEVKDSHDRYANIEVSYLLQQMEAYRGLAVLTSNMKSALDPAFLRRIRFIVQFPFPDTAQRAAIWERVFPAATPTAGIAIGKLARLNIAGGNIRNIALNAAFLAADAGTSVGMAHLLQAARSEYAKLEKPLAASEVRDWTTG